MNLVLTILRLKYYKKLAVGKLTSKPGNVGSMLSKESMADSIWLLNTEIKIKNI